MKCKPVFFLILMMLFAPLLQKGALARPSFSDLLNKRYDLGLALYHNLNIDPGSRGDSPRWRHCADYFRSVYHMSPSHPRAPLSLYMLARIYEELYRQSKSPLDRGESVAYYEDLAVIFPKHRLADDALLALGRMALAQQDLQKAEKHLARVIAVYPGGDMAAEAAALLREMKGQAGGVIAGGVADKESNKTPESMVVLNEPIRFWSSRGYTRVVVETSGPVRYKEAFLPADGKLPRRLYIDLFNCRITPTFQNAIPIRDGLLKQVRGAQFDRQTVRIVLDTESVDKYKIFSLEDPFRVVIDVTGSTPRQEMRVPTLAEQFGLGVKTIVIDPGHGGKDPGAVGVNGLLEKDVVLKVARKVAEIFRKETSYNVILTRERDVFIPLEERTAIANMNDADLFLSIHANSAPNGKARGVETYFLSLATSREEMQTAALENAASSSQLSDLQTILQDLMQNSKIEESARLAGKVQEKLVSGLNRMYRVKNLGVKKAPFIVLIGARMPAILTEIAFLSNREDEKRLRDDRYLEALSREIVNGVSHYVSSLNLARNNL